MAKYVYLKKTCNNFFNVKNILNTSKKLIAEFSQTLLRKDRIIIYNKIYLIIANQEDKKNNIETFKKIKFNSNSTFIYV